VVVVQLVEFVVEKRARCFVSVDFGLDGGAYACSFVSSAKLGQVGMNVGVHLIKDSEEAVAGGVREILLFKLVIANELKDVVSF